MKKNVVVGYKCPGCGHGKYRKGNVTGWGTQYYCPKCTVEISNPRHWCQGQKCDKLNIEEIMNRLFMVYKGDQPLSGCKSKAPWISGFG